MREIKFKGKDIVGNWYTGNLAIVKHDIHNGAGTIKAGSYISNEFGSPFAYQIRPETVGQYTGLRDKNGRMIFEGDIVSYEDISGVEDGVGNVLFDLFYGAWFVFVNDYEENSLADVAYNCEIIGKIHDNPEMMKRYGAGE